MCSHKNGVTKVNNQTDAQGLEQARTRSYLFAEVILYFSCI